MYLCTLKRFTLFSVRIGSVNIIGKPYTRNSLTAYIKQDLFYSVILETVYTLTLTRLQFSYNFLFFQLITKQSGTR